MEKYPVIYRTGRLATSLVFWVLLVAGQPQSCQAGVFTPSGSSSPKQSVEEVNVYGQKPTDLFRMLLQSDRQIYDFFNDWNTDDRFDMVCRKQARIGSQIRYQVCKPRFVKQAESMAAEDLPDTGFFNVNQAKMQRLRQLQRELMAELANENPEFMEFLKERGELRKAYKKARAGKLHSPSWEVQPDVENHSGPR